MELSSGVTPAADRTTRGRDAHKPHQIPKRGWRDILLRTKDQIGADNLSLVSAGVAFYALLAVFPGLAASVSLYGLLTNGADIERHFQNLAVFMPPEARPVLLDQVHALAASSGTALGLTAFGGILLALVSTMKGVKAMITALNIAYDEREKRGFVRLNLLAFVLTVAAVLYLVVMLVLVVAVPAVVDFLGVGGTMGHLLSMLRWPILLVAVLVGLSALYHFAPNRNQPRWHWVSWGSVVATLLWLLASIGFSVYVQHFGNYNKVYGSLGALVVLLMWFYISAYAVLLGAELNAEMEHQTEIDTTVGRPKPLGSRGAYVADTVGEPR